MAEDYKKSINQPPLQFLEAVVGHAVETNENRSLVKIHIDEKILAKAEEDDKLSSTTKLYKSILEKLDKKSEIVRLAFEVDPNNYGAKYSSLYRARQNLLSWELIKRIAIKTDLVAAILQARQNHISSFGRMRPDRLSIGFAIEPKQEIIERLELIKDEEEQKAKKTELQKRIYEVSKKILTCGSTEGFSKDKVLPFGTFLAEQTRNSLMFGRFVTEIIPTINNKGEKEFHAFRVIDAGTVYKLNPVQSHAQSVRDDSLSLMREIYDESALEGQKFIIDFDKYTNNEYTWAQVINGKPVQVFTSDECLVHNCYPVSDVEFGGYPLTPLDTITSAVFTYINITTHNELYFENGRAARGMLIIKSDNNNQSTVSRVRQAFNTAINSVNNSWRCPVFGIGPDDDMIWQPLDGSTRDMEFQYLSDMNSRVILSAFQMSPEELPGWSFLSRGTNSQALSESNSEYKLEAARDQGLRPLLKQFEDFMNYYIMPLMDEDLANTCVFKFVGLDAETPEKEGIRLAQDQLLHYTYDDILQKVEKTPIGKQWGGQFPLNPNYQMILDKYFTVGQIQEHFFGIEGAAQNPDFAYVRDQFWFNFKQMQEQKQAQEQALQQQQIEQERAMLEPADPQPQSDDTENLARNEAILGQVLSKGEMNLSSGKRTLLAQHKVLVDNVMKGLEKDLKEVVNDIKFVIEKDLPKKK